MIPCFSLGCIPAFSASFSAFASTSRMTTGSGDFCAFFEVACRVRDLDVRVGMTATFSDRMLMIHVPLQEADFLPADTTQTLIPGIDHSPGDRFRGNTCLAGTAHCFSRLHLVWVTFLPGKLGVPCAVDAPFDPDQTTRPCAHTRQPPQEAASRCIRSVMTSFQSVPFSERRLCGLPYLRVDLAFAARPALDSTYCESVSFLLSMPTAHESVTYILYVNMREAAASLGPSLKVYARVLRFRSEHGAPTGKGSAQTSRSC